MEPYEVLLCLLLNDVFLPMILIVKKISERFKSPFIPLAFPTVQYSHDAVKSRLTICPATANRKEEKMLNFCRIKSKTGRELPGLIPLQMDGVFLRNTENPSSPGIFMKP